MKKKKNLNETKIWFFRKIKKIDKPLSKTDKEKRKDILYYINCRH